MVEYVECFKTKLHRMVFAVRHGETFREGHVDRLKMRRDHRISANTSERALGRHYERCRIEPSEALARGRWCRKVSGTNSRKAWAIWQRVVRAGIIDTGCECQRHTALDCRVVLSCQPPMNALATALLKPKNFPWPIGKS